MITKKELLRKRYDEFYKLKYPSIPFDLDIVELADDDGYIIGNVDTFLSGGFLKFSSHGVRKEILEKIEKYKPKTQNDQQDLEYIKFYIDKLEKLNKLLKDCLDKS